jgi:hypothetical protein
MGDAWSKRSKYPKAAVLLAALLQLCACASGLDLGKAEVDKTFYTSSVPAGPSADAIDPSQLSDVATIRNAISSADVEQAGGKALAWANSDTGSRGSITDLVEYKDNGALCRRFQATRESFDGVSMFSGDACLATAGAWRMRSFEAL